MDMQRTLQHMYWSKYSLCYVPILIYLLYTIRTTKVHFSVLFYYIGHLICLYLRPFGCCFQESWDVYNDCSQSHWNDVVQNPMRSWIKLVVDMRGANSHVSLWKSRKTCMYLYAKTKSPLFVVCMCKKSILRNVHT